MRLRLRLHRLAVTLALASMLPLSIAIAILNPVPANAATVVKIENGYTSECLNAWNWYNGSGDVVLLGTCNTWNWNSWIIEQESGYVRIVLAYHDNMCLDGVLGTNGVTVKACTAGDLHQRWIETTPVGEDGAVKALENLYTTRCLDGTFDYGARAMPCQGAGDTHQWWGAGGPP